MYQPNEERLKQETMQQVNTNWRDPNWRTLHNEAGGTLPALATDVLHFGCLVMPGLIGAYFAFLLVQTQAHLFCPKGDRAGRRLYNQHQGPFRMTR